MKVGLPFYRLWSWPKIAASLICAGSITGAVSVAVLQKEPAVSAQSSANAQQTAPTAPAKPAASPVDQTSPLACLRKLSVSIQTNDRTGIVECLCDNGSDADVAALMRAVFIQDASSTRLRKAWAAKLDGPMDFKGMSLDSFPGEVRSIEGFLQKLLEMTDESMVEVDGNTAQLRVPLAPEAFSGTGPNRQTSMARWSGATLVLNRVDGKWKLNTDRTFNPFVDVARKPGNETDAIAIERKVSEELGDSINEIAAEIENGSITSVQDAVAAVRSAGKQSCVNTGINGDNIQLFPVIGG